MNKKDYHCEVCDKYFSTFYGLSGHLAANHGGQKLNCDLCSAEFSYPLTVKIKKKTWKKEKRLNSFTLHFHIQLILISYLCVFVFSVSII
jgi:hypothetical protein